MLKINWSLYRYFGMYVLLFFLPLLLHSEAAVGKYLLKLGTEGCILGLLLLPITFKAIHDFGCNFALIVQSFWKSKPWKSILKSAVCWSHYFRGCYFFFWGFFVRLRNTLLALQDPTPQQPRHNIWMHYFIGWDPHRRRHKGLRVTEAAGFLQNQNQHFKLGIRKT